MKKTNKNGVWQSIFDQIGAQIKSSIDSQGYFDITANSLKEFSNPLNGPDTRNLAKFDKSYSLPTVFKENAHDISEYINIMPLGYINKEYTYRLGRFNAYEPLNIEEDQKPEQIHFPKVQTITPDNIPSENAYIDAAFSSGMLTRVFSHHNDPLLPVLHGRMGSGPMDFYIGAQHPQRLQVHSAQIEIDATFENQESVVIIEAKAVPESDFLVRQLFYPYYVIRHRGVTKPIRPAFLSLLGGNYYFNEYIFEDPNNYSTIRMINQRAFRLYDESPITLEELVTLSKTIRTIPEPQKIPFPQANSYLKLVKALNVLNEAFRDEDNGHNGLSSPEIAEMFKYDARQGGYYGNLVYYLGLCEKEGTYFIINDKGRNLLKALDTNEGKRILIKLLLQHKPFQISFDYLIANPLKQNHALTADDKVSLCRQIQPYVTVRDSTITRRIESVVSLLRTAVFDAVDA